METLETKLNKLCGRLVKLEQKVGLGINVETDRPESTETKINVPLGGSIIFTSNGSIKQDLKKGSVFVKQDNDTILSGKGRPDDPNQDAINENKCKDQHNFTYTDTNSHITWTFIQDVYPSGINNASGRYYNSVDPLDIIEFDPNRYCGIENLCISSYSVEVPQTTITYGQVFIGRYESDNNTTQFIDYLVTPPSTQPPPPSDPPKGRLLSTSISGTIIATTDVDNMHIYTRNPEIDKYNIEETIAIQTPLNNILGIERYALQVSGNGQKIIVINDTNTKAIVYTKIIPTAIWDNGVELQGIAGASSVYSVSISNNGNIAMIASKADNNIYVLNYANNTWSLTDTISYANLDTAKMGGNGNKILASSSTNILTVFTYINGMWDSGTVVNAPNFSAGLRTDISDDGNTLLVTSTFGISNNNQRITIYENGDYTNGLDIQTGVVYTTFSLAKLGNIFVIVYSGGFTILFYKINNVWKSLLSPLDLPEGDPNSYSVSLA